MGAPGCLRPDGAVAARARPGAVATRRRRVAAGAFWSHAAAFVAGGLFFSSAVAAGAAVYALGAENARRVAGVLLTVARRLVRLVGAALRAAYALLVDESGTWEDAKRVLREGLREARRAAEEGVSAIRLESDLFAAAVGPPGLVTLQYALDRLMPHSLGRSIEEAIADALRTAEVPNAQKLIARRVEAGAAVPRLLAARVYDVGPDALAFDVDVRWRSELRVRLDVVPRGLAGGVGARLPVDCRDVSFEGTVRCVLAPLVDDPPGYGAILLSLPAAPAITLDVKVAGGEVTKVPWLRQAIMDGISESFDETLIWPKRVVVPATNAAGRPLLARDDLVELERDDPLLHAERRLREEPVLQGQGDILRVAAGGDRAAATTVTFEAELRAEEAERAQEAAAAQERLLAKEEGTFWQQTQAIAARATSEAWRSSKDAVRAWREGRESARRADESGGGGGKEGAAV